MTLMLKIIVIFITVLSVNQVAALTEEERIGGMVGEFFGAVVLANEFAGTACGKTAKWGDRYTNIDMALLEIKSKYPRMANKIDEGLTPNEIATIRRDMKVLISKMDLTKCEEVKMVIKKTYDDTRQKWSAFK